MNKLFSNAPTFQFVLVGKNEWGPFQNNRNQLKLALSQPNSSESIYGYKVSNMSSKNKISVFLLAFFLLYII